MPSPIAVDALGWRPWMAAVAAPRSWVGGTSVVAVPAKDTTATLNFGGSAVTKPPAADLAASSRFGWTSVASIDSDTSIVTTIVARSRGTDTSPFGFAYATVSVSRLRIDSPTATCRSQVRSRGITRSNIVRAIRAFRLRLRLTRYR